MARKQGAELILGRQVTPSRFSGRAFEVLG
jgi:hypothetical protein